MRSLSARMKIVLLSVYVFILAAIILVANQKGTRRVLSFVGEIPYGDKLGHFLLMGGFSFLANLALNARETGFGRLSYLAGSLIVAFLVTAEEFSQIFVRGRSFDWKDLFFDYLGILLFGELARRLLREKPGAGK